MYSHSPTGIVNFLISTELEQFKQDYDVSPIPKSQDIGSLSIEWLCYYCKEQVSNENKNEILDVVDSILCREDFNFGSWFRIPALLAAAFTLTGKEYYLNDVLVNLACMQSVHRGFICQVLTVICQDLPFDNHYFKSSVLSNLEKRHGFDEISTLLLLNSQGDRIHKKTWIIENLDVLPLTAKNFLSDLLTGKEYNEIFFQHTINSIKSHILFRILKHSYLYNNQPSLFESNQRVYSRTLNVFNDSHPLDKVIFNFDL
jgi:hypothetical protein